MELFGERCGAGIAALFVTIFTDGDADLLKVEIGLALGKSEGDKVKIATSSSVYACFLFLKSMSLLDSPSNAASRTQDMHMTHFGRFVVEDPIVLYQASRLYPKCKWPPLH